MTPDKTIVRKVQQVGILERICQALELTETQFKSAKDHYEAVSKFLAKAESPFLHGAYIFPQGSLSYGTTVRPVGYQEFDLDLVVLLPGLLPSMIPAMVKKLVGDRLKEHSFYKKILKEKARCWRLDYANEFHLDITPAILNPQCIAGGELVPDKHVQDWKPTNPKGYSVWFNKLAELQPRIQLIKERALLKAQIDELPEPTRFKGFLKRCVQLCKRHRDLAFLGQNKEIAPISIVITILAAKAYESCVTHFDYETEFDVLLDVVRRMPDFIEIQKVGDRLLYFVWNETTQGENFAEKWNKDLRLPRAFYAWQKKALQGLEDLNTTRGRDELNKSLSSSFGDKPVNQAMGIFTAGVSAARAGGGLSVLPNLGLTTNSSKSIKIPSNTFFGA